MKKTFIMLLGLCLISPMLYADDSSPGFWEMLRMKIEQLTPQTKLSTTTAVGGVRGAPAEANDLYWKGEAKPATIDADELAAFQKAMSLVDAGKKTEAQSAFSDFSKKYPDSPLRKDADQALAQLRSK
jgi:TolA-binding protein